MRGELDSSPLGYLTLLLGVWLFKPMVVFVRECVCVWVPVPALPLGGGGDHAYNWSPHVHTVSRGTCRKILVGVAIYRRSLHAFTSFCGPRFLKSEATLLSGIDEKKVGTSCRHLPGKQQSTQAMRKQKATHAPSA
jgi:hypothetical protein